MKQRAKLLIILLLFVCGFFTYSSAFADKTVKLKLNIAVDAANPYYFCLQDFGCLKIIPGKTYHLYRRINTQQIYIMKPSDRLKVIPLQRVPSCNATIQRGQTITISGNLIGGYNPRVTGLYCSIK